MMRRAPGCHEGAEGKSRKARKVTNYMGADVTVYESIDPAITSEFVGYDKLSWESGVTAMTTEEAVVDALTDGESGTIIVAPDTPSTEPWADSAAIPA